MTPRTAADPEAHDASDPFLGPNIEAERAIVAAVMLGIENVREARGLLQAKHFHREHHAWIFTAALAVADRDEIPDLISVSAELQKTGRLEQIGGRHKLAEILEYASAIGNLKQRARIVRERSVRNDARVAGRKLIESAEDVSKPIEESIQTHRKSMRTIVEDQAAIEKRAWMQQILTLKDVLETDFPPIESIIGNGILTQASYGLFAGHSGLGKTYLTIQMMAAILAGESFLGQPTKPCRIGLLEFEMPWQSMKARALRYGLDLSHYGLGADLLCMPKGRWYFTERDVIERIVDWCGERSLKLLVPDPLNRIRQGDANDEQVAGELLDAIHEITERTGTTILAVSHVRKAPAGGTGGPRTSTTSLDSIKGPSRYVDDADTVFMIDEVIEGTQRLTRFEWAKSRFGEKPAHVYLRRMSNGFFEQVESPTAKREQENENVEQVLRAAWMNGVRVNQVEVQFSVSRDSARRMLVRVGAVPRGSTQDRKYYHPECLAELEPALPGMEDES